MFSYLYLAYVQETRRETMHNECVSEQILSSRDSMIAACDLKYVNNCRVCAKKISRYQSLVFNMLFTHVSLLLASYFMNAGLCHGHML